jgi:hypothetical protein
VCYREVSPLISDTLNVTNIRYETNHNKEEERKESKFSKREMSPYNDYWLQIHSNKKYIRLNENIIK